MLDDTYRHLPAPQQRLLQRCARLLDAGRRDHLDCFLSKCTAREREAVSANLRAYYRAPNRPVTRSMRREQRAGSGRYPPG